MKKTALTLGLLLMATLLITGCQKNDSMMEKDSMMKKDSMMGAKMTAKLHILSEAGLAAEVGTITVTDLGDKGIAITVKGSNMKPGDHGFHIHQRSNLSPLVRADGSLLVGGMAGGHWDPDNTKVHSGPDGKGHRGDLPFLSVASDGTVDVTIEVSKISYKDIKGKSFMVHAGGDNYSDNPKALGGGGARMYGAPFN